MWEIRECAPTSESRIRRLALTSHDGVSYNESNQRPDALVRFDPQTEKFQS